ncbi:MAG: hypothetical protein R2851_20415 [Caldilineaceae bacterium]
MTQPTQTAAAYAAANQVPFTATVDLIRLPSVSTQPEHADDNGRRGGVDSRRHARHRHGDRRGDPCRRPPSAGAGHGPAREQTPTVLITTALPALYSRSHEVTAGTHAALPHRPGRQALRAQRHRCSR